MADFRSLRANVAAAAAAFAEGDERLTLTLLRRERDSHPPGTLHWAYLERLTGLVLIHMLREVEGTFALERADTVLDALHAERPGLSWLEEAQSGSGPLAHSAKE